MADAVAVLGAGVSGQAAARLARACGATDVCIYDETGCGGVAKFSDESLDAHDVFIFSPGFEAQHPWRLRVKNSGKSYYGEVGYAASLWKGKLFAITGTNGKTTLTKFLAEALNALGEEAYAVGNIGEPFSDLVRSDANREGSIAVCEISSFQAELVHGVELDAFLWTNFAEDHLDRYASLLEYFEAKAKLFDCIKPAGVCVVGPQVVHWMEVLHKEYTGYTVACHDSDLSAQLKTGSPFTRLPYVENFSIAAQLWSLMNYSPQALIRTASQFEMAPHRLDVTAEIDGVCFWNDSKSTNFHAALAALDAQDGPVYWIGGGQPKGGDLGAFAEALSSRIAGAFLYGEVAPSLAGVLAEKLDIVRIYGPFDQAVLAAAAAAFEDGVSHVVMSPGFSSLDQFPSYSERGKSFISIVLSLNDDSAVR